MDWGPSGGVNFGYAGVEDMQVNRNLAKIVNKIDPKEHFVIIAQTRRAGGKTMFLAGCFEGGHVMLLSDGKLERVHASTRKK
jgi:hypothetical protein